MTQYNFYLASSGTVKGNTLPLLWASAKTYYEENSSKADQWNWCDPHIASDNNIEQILEICKNEPPDVFGFSIYLWNAEFMYDLAKQVKSQHPSCLIIYGGPHVNIRYSDTFFKENPWVDAVCPSDAYGEVVIKDVLDNFPISNFENVSYIYYPDSNKNKILSKKVLDKRSFVWPTNIFKAQEQELLKREYVYSLFETTRGCPYKCIYCDWGGGTYTKINKKPFSTVLDEWEWLAKNKIDQIHISDANFGIMEIDLEIADFIVECRKKYDSPSVLALDGSKNNHKRNFEIYKKFVSANLARHYKIAVQALNDTIKENIERIDVPFEDQVEAVKFFKKNYPLIGIRIETILGLPGDNYEVTLAQIDKHTDNDLPISRPEQWVLLPEAPAYDPEIRKKFKIGTINKRFLHNPLTLKAGSTPDPGVTYINELDPSPHVEYVVETYSYSRDEFVDMLLITAIASAGIGSGLEFVWKYLIKEHNAKGSTVLDIIYKECIKPANFKNQELKNNFQTLVSTVNGFVKDDSITRFEIDYHPDFPLLLPPHIFILFSILLNIADFYKEITDLLGQQFNDKRITDLGHYISNRTIDVTYDFDSGRIFKTKYNWWEYFDGHPLTDGDYTLQMYDDLIIINPNKSININPDWHKYEKGSLLQKKQFYYQSVTRFDSQRFGQKIKLL